MNEHYSAKFGYDIMNKYTSNLPPIRETLTPRCLVASSGINNGGPVAKDTIVPIEENHV